MIHTKDIPMSSLPIIFAINLFLYILKYNIIYSMRVDPLIVVELIPTIVMDTELMVVIPFFPEEIFPFSHTLVYKA